ncbi:MAG: hypothetical protein AB7V56_12595 [Candidatus Nitrosocosmicus sp.]
MVDIILPNEVIKQCVNEVLKKLHEKTKGNEETPIELDELFKGLNYQTEQILNEGNSKKVVLQPLKGEKFIDCKEGSE